MDHTELSSICLQFLSGLAETLGKIRDHYKVPAMHWAPHTYQNIKTEFSMESPTYIRGEIPKSDLTYSIYQGNVQCVITCSTLSQVNSMSRGQIVENRGFVEEVTLERPLAML